MRTPYLILVLVSAGLVRAAVAGIPFDRSTGRVTERHEMVSLNEAQRGEYAARQQITLTREQHQRLDRRCRNFPPVIRAVLSYRWNDCTCCVERPYAIMMPSGDAIAIPESEFALFRQCGEIRRSGPPVARQPSAWSRFWSGIF